MRTPDIEGVAIHGGPELCVGDPRGRSEALTGVRAGQPLSREIRLVRGADAVPQAEGHIVGGASASRRRTPRGRRTCACTDLVRENRESPLLARPGDHRAGRSGNAEAASLRCTSVGSRMEA